ncbi:hypothetical protein [Arthrobacter sp.]|uniref:hypothetical protein n=1 Tax=Arthrobacter sp. TaxID=1667 RepID=UPI003A938BDA
MAPQQSRPGRSRKPSPEVFRRRRIVAAVALLVILALLAWAVIAVAGLFAGGHDEAATQDTPAPVTSPSASGSTAPSASASATSSPSPSFGAAEGSSSAVAGPECASDDIELRSSTDKSTYSSGEDPVLEMKITNSGTEDCSLNVGTSQQEFNIVSGSDRIFSTTDCRANATDSVMTLKAGATESARFTWERLRSAPGCKKVTTKPRPGTYTFTAKLGAVESDKATFSLK